MDQEKCFCHFNGYQVKDATARKNVENIEKTMKEDKEKIKGISESAFNVGDGCLAGLHGYYYSEIDFENKTVNLSVKQNTAEDPIDVIGWDVGDVVSIVNGTKYELCAKITGIIGNVITLDKIPFESIVQDDEPTFDDWSICVPAKPDAGVVDLGKAAIASGDRNKALNWGAAANGGRENTVTAQYGSIDGGRENTVDGYAGFIGGGQGNSIAPGVRWAAVFNAGNKATADGQTVLGLNAVEDPNAMLIVGNGTDKNAFVVKKDGSVYANNVKLVDANTNWSKVDDSRPVKSGVALRTILRSGFYKLSDSHPDMPTGCEWGQMIVSADNASQAQFVIPTSGKAIYWRAATHGNYPEKWKNLLPDNTLSISGQPADAAETGRRINVEKARIDNLSKLGEGSTTGDAELMDIRVGEDGKVFGSAGEAVREQIREVKNFGVEGLYAQSPDTNMADFITIDGAIYQETGGEANGDEINSSYIRSGFIPVGAGEVIRYDSMVCPTNFAPVVVYDKNKIFVSRVKGQGLEKRLSGNLKMPQDGFIRLCTKRSEKSGAKVELISQKKELNILVLGNSFSQDAFAYLPPVLNEILPEYKISYAVCYRSSADVRDHIKLFNGELGTPYTEPVNGKYDGKYTWFNYWNYGANKWERGTGTNSKTLQEVMALKKWDIIYVQPATSVPSDPTEHDTQVNDNIVTPGRELLRILQDLNGGHFAFMMGQWLATSSNGDNGETVFARLVSAMHKTKQRIGIYDYIPIGTAIQNARTNETLQALGETGNMLYDTHMQSGVPALIAAYTVALKILDYVGDTKRGIYGSKFLPTTENCIAINAYKSEGMVTPLPMTHGESVGVTSENIKAAQEIAVLAVNNPLSIAECENIIV